MPCTHTRAGRPHWSSLLPTLLLTIACRGEPVPSPAPPTPAEAPAPSPETAGPSPSGATPAQGRSGPRPEPVTLDVPGWQRTDEDVPRSWQRTTTLRQGDATVVMDRWFGTPPTPGGPMVVAEQRPVTISGEQHTLQRTSMFQGRPDEVDVVFLRDTGWQVRIVFRGCSEAQLAEVLAAVRVGT